MSAQNRQYTDESQGRLSKHGTRHQRTVWRNALASLASPIVRLHQLRNVRTQMFHEALNDLDHCEPREPCA